MFISLSSSCAGNACAVKQSIINYDVNEITQFFDWLVCSIKSINEILEKTPILFEENSMHLNLLNSMSINFKNFDLLISHHDIHEFNINTINEITEKYERRLERFFLTIQNQKEIFFIRYCKNQNDIEETQIHKFCENIKNINPILNFKFILISNDNTLQLSNNLINNANVMYINLYNYIDDDIINETNTYLKIIKQYKCVYNIVKKSTF